MVAAGADSIVEASDPRVLDYVDYVCMYGIVHLNNFSKYLSDSSRSSNTCPGRSPILRNASILTLDQLILMLNVCMYVCMYVCIFFQWNPS